MPEALQYDPDFGRRTTSLAFVFTQAGFARLLDVNASSVSRWCKGTDRPTGVNATAVVDLDYVVSRYSLEYPIATFQDWFSTPNAFLDGAAPKHVLLLEGPSRVVDALSSETAGSYA